MLNSKENPRSIQGKNPRSNYICKTFSVVKNTSYRTHISLISHTMELRKKNRWILLWNLLWLCAFLLTFIKLCRYVMLNYECSCVCVFVCFLFLCVYVRVQESVLNYTHYYFVNIKQKKISILKSISDLLCSIYVYDGEGQVETEDFVEKSWLCNCKVKNCCLFLLSFFHECIINNIITKWLQKSISLKPKAYF